MSDFVDIHSHLNFPEFDADRAEAISRMRAAKVATITVGTSLITSESALALARAETKNDIFASVGLHPTEAALWIESIREKFQKFAREPEVVAIGECGLDYSRLPAGDSSGRKKQREVFEEQIALAIEINKPLMLHCRDTYSEVHDVLESFKRGAGDKLRGNVHFFSGDAVTAKKFLDIDFALSFSGVITFARNYDEAVRFTPLGSIMSETDSPFAAPVPYRGKRNEPSYVPEVVRAVSLIKGLDFETARVALTANARKFFGLKSVG